MPIDVFSLLVVFLHPQLVAFLTVWAAGLREPLLLPIQLGVDCQVQLLLRPLDL